MNDLAFVPLLPARATIDGARRGPARTGEERYAVIMFVDMRGSSQIAETQLPYDTMFLLNQFLGAVASAVAGAGGRPNQALGDGLLAVFGLDGDPDQACRDAVAACAAVAAHVETLNHALSHGSLPTVRFGIGVSAGLVIAGEIAFGGRSQFTVIGDAVNIAARLEALTKTVGCEALIAEEVCLRAGLPHDALPQREFEARGRENKVLVRVVTRAAELARLCERS